MELAKADIFHESLSISKNSIVCGRDDPKLADDGGKVPKGNPSCYGFDP